MSAKAVEQFTAERDTRKIEFGFWKSFINGDTIPIIRKSNASRLVTVGRGAVNKSRNGNTLTMLRIQSVIARQRANGPSAIPKRYASGTNAKDQFGVGHQWGILQMINGHNSKKNLITGVPIVERGQYLLKTMSSRLVRGAHIHLPISFRPANRAIVKRVAEVPYKRE